MRRDVLDNLGDGTTHLYEERAFVIRFESEDLFDAPYDVTYVQGRIDALGSQTRTAWVETVDQLRKCANPPKGMRVTDDAKALAKAKIKELSARNRHRVR